MQFFQNIRLLCCSGREEKPNFTIKLQHIENTSSTDEKSSQVKKKKNRQKKRRPWLKQEDETLLYYYKIYPQNWQQISKLMNCRSGKQIRDRYINVLDPKINQNQWTLEEDNIVYFNQFQIIQQYLKVGTKWSIIANFLQGRPENMVKNRFYSCLKKKISDDDLNIDQKAKYKSLFIQNKNDLHQDDFYHEQNTINYSTNFENYQNEYLNQNPNTYFNQVIILNTNQPIDMDNIAQNNLQQIEKYQSIENKQQFYDNLEKKYTDILNTSESVNCNLQVSFSNSENNLIQQHIQQFEIEQDNLIRNDQCFEQQIKMEIEDI